MQYTVLTGADFSGANLYNARLDFSDAGGADFSNADLTNANFAKADLTDANMNGASLNTVQWAWAICPDNTDSLQNDNSCCDNLNGAVAVTCDGEPWNF